MKYSVKYGENYNFIESKQLVEKKDGTTIIQQGEKDTDKYVKSGKIVEEGKTQKLVLDITDKEGNVSNVDITLPSYLKDSDIVNNAVIKTAITEELAKLDNKYGLKTKLDELELKVNGIKLEEKDPIWLKEKTEYLKTADADKKYLTEHQSLEDYAKKTELPKIPTKVSAFENDRNYLTEHQKLDDYLKKAELPKIPTKTSDLTNDSNFISKHQSLDEYAKKTDIPKIPTKVSVFENDRNYLTEHQSLEEYAKKSELTPLLTSEKADSTFVKTVSLEYEKENGALSVVVNGNKNTVELPMDKFLKSVSLDEDKKNIVFSFNDKDSSSIKLPTTDLITTYVGGDGIKVVDTTISLDPNKLNLLLTKTEAEEKYLKIVDKPKVPTKVGELENDKNYLTSHQSLVDYAKKSELPTNIGQLTNDKNFITKDEVANAYLPKTKEAELLAKIPTKTSDLTNDEGFLKEHQPLTDYVKKTELSDFATKTDITKLNNIDTELKEDSDNLVTNRAITKVIIDNEKIVAALVNDLNTRIKQKPEMGQLYGEFVIKAEKHEEELTELTIKPNTYYQLGTVKKLTLTLSPIEDDKRYNEYMVEFVSGAEPTQLILPPQVKWIGSDVITTNRKYQLSIVNDLAVIGGSKLAQTN